MKYEPHSKATFENTVEEIKAGPSPGLLFCSAVLLDIILICQIFNTKNLTNLLK